jgi:hypothetical protein
MKQHPSPGDLVVLKENPKYSGIVITRKIVDNTFKDSLGLEPYYTLDVLWNIGDIPIGEVGSLGIGSGNLRSIIEDLVEVQNPAG